MRTMVLEQLLDRRIVLQHAPFAFALGLLYVFIAFLVQTFFFPQNGLSIVLLLIILILPSLHHLIVIEEKLERTGTSHFWHRHHTIIKSYIGVFFGILAGFLLLSFFAPHTLQYQITQLEQDHLKPETIQSFTGRPYTPSIGTALALFSRNMNYLILGLALSLFYGAGASFLVAYNASFFAAFVQGIFARFPNPAMLTGVSLIHLLPESAGYILMAIAGATLSRGIIREKLKGEAFRNVLKNVILMLLLSTALILVAALLETFVTAAVFHSSIAHLSASIP